MKRIISVVVLFSIVILLCSCGKKVNVPEDIAKIKQIVCATELWACEGGIAHPDDRYTFNFDNMTFIYYSSVKHNKYYTYNMKVIDENTIEVSGVRIRSESPALITVVNNKKLRITFIDESMNKGEYYLIFPEEKSTESINVPTEPETESTLTDDEERLLSYLKKSITSFKNPASVRIIEVFAYDKEDDVFYVEISAENSLGGTTKALYEVKKREIYESMSSTESIKRMPSAFGDYCSCDVATINKLLKEYYNEKGWD